MGKSESFAKSKMYEKRYNQYRTEQIEIYKQLRDERPNCNLLMEYEIRYTNEEGLPRVAIADIADLTKKEVIRINGAIHNSHVREEKDWMQKEYLQQLGWKVTDIDV
jgi:very-short-patch-repair endonuclease